ncbi:DUF5667 domain-containing protein [Streptomyces roseoverticillatus]|uniref:DUF5667 domain-containing protein n=1 Tax=Streptomyces roseoverticillatus TaxID=66429 RepID=UPI0004C1594C|nr:DUF5667 domain-containing protein [Streptomyces roseoverticillatus]
MIANVSAHRRANAFAQSLEHQEVQGTAATEPDPPAEGGEQGRLLALTGRLGELPRPGLDPETRVVQRAQLIAAMETQFAGGDSAAIPEQKTRRSGRGAHRALGRLRPRSRWSKGLAAGGLTVGVAAGAFGGVAAASSNALPGDSLYPLKRGMEDLRLGMADDDSDRGSLLLDRASTRLQEARRLMERGKLGGHLDHEVLGEIRRTLSGMRQDASEGHRLLHTAYKHDRSIGPIQRLSSFASSHRESWDQLRGKLPVQLADVGAEVSSVLSAIDDEVGSLRSLLPPAHHGKHGSPAQSETDRAGTSGHTARHSPQPSASASGGGKHAGGSKQQPASPGAHEEHEGLLGGTGLLKPPSPPGSATPGGTPRSKDSKPAKQPSIDIPPVLPQIIPGLGIQGGEDPK